MFNDEQCRSNCQLKINMNLLLIQKLLIVNVNKKIFKTYFLQFIYFCNVEIVC